MQTEPKLNVDTHANACWLRLVVHAQSGRCTCHLGVAGSVHVLDGCSVGRMLRDEYTIAKAEEKARAESKLEAGDFEAPDTFAGCTDEWRGARSHLYGPDGKLLPGVKP